MTRGAHVKDAQDVRPWYLAAMTWELEPRDAVVVVHMRSNKVNRMNPAMFVDAQVAFDRLDAEFPGRPVVLTGDGATFSAGLDFAHVFPLFQRGDQTEIGAFFAEFRGMIVRILTAPRRTVAAVNGHAFAGGFILACACDARVLAHGPARLALNEVPIGIPMPSTYVEIVRHALGSRFAIEATLEGRIYDVAEVAAEGFARTVAPPERLLEAAIAVATIPGLPDTAVAYAGAKRSLLGPLMALLDGPSRALDAACFAEVASPASARAQLAAAARLKAR